MTKDIKGDESVATIAYDDLTHENKSALTRALNKGATRREAMQIMMAAGMTAAAAGSLVAAAGDAIAQTPKKGGSIRYSSSLHGPDDKMKPYEFTSNIDYSRGRAHFNSLVQLDDDIVPQPELAQEFGPNKDASVWTFKLREDVRFHDGSKFSADDVMATMATHYGEDSTSVVKTLVAGVKEWKKLGPYEVQAVLDSPNSDFATLLGEKQFKIAKAGTLDDQVPVGSGPFKTVDFQPGVRSKQIRNEDYWRDGANVDEIEIFAITDPVARVNALMSGDVDMAIQIDPKAIKQVESNPGSKIISTVSGAYMGFCLMLDKAPGNNPDFVKGMKLLQRRDKIVKSILKGQGTVGNDHPINSAYGVDFCKELPIRDFDPDQAKHFLNKSGVDGATFHVAEVMPGITDASLMWQRECQKIGFNLEIKKVPTDGYWGAVWLKEPLNAVTWNMRPTATVMLDIAFAPDAPWNDTVWKNERMGELLKMSKAETDPAKKYEIQCEMQTLAHDESGMIIPAHQNYTDGAADSIMGITKNPLGAFGGCEWPEFVWKA